MNFPFGKAGNCTSFTHRDEKHILGVPPDRSESSLPPLAKVCGILGTMWVHEAPDYIAIPESSSKGICNSIEVLITSRTKGHVIEERGEKGGGREK